MNTPTHRRRHPRFTSPVPPVSVLLCGLLVLVAACSSDTGTATVESVDTLLEQSATVMAAVETASFSVEKTGAAVFIDDNDAIQFLDARGRYAAPAASDAVIGVKALGLTTEVGAVAIDGQIWITNPVTGKWEEAPDSFSFDPSILFDTETGWSSLLTEGLEDPTLVPAADTDEGRHHIRSSVAGDRVASLTGGLVDEASVIELWIDPDDSRVVEVAFDVETDDGPTGWRLLLTDFDKEITISKPDIAG